jgi:hypothetical protein
MNSEERKTVLHKLAKEQEPCRTGNPIMYKGIRIELPAYRIPLEYLVYNPYNGRIGSVVKSYERQYHELNPEVKEDRNLIEKFLMQSKPEANKVTRRRLLTEHQQKLGIVTSDGIIIDGNRRAMLLNDLMKDNSIEYSKKAHCKYFDAIILPDDIDKKDILALETTYQMGEDAKVDYDPIEKYLKSKDLYSEDFSYEDIAGFMDIEPSEVKSMLSVLKLMEDYLDTYEYEGIYTQLDKREDKFIRLDTALKKYKAGVSTMWDYDPEGDVSDLRMIAFDYIRAQFENNPFRTIITASTGKNQATSFFAQKDIWETFRDNHMNMVDAVEEETVEELMQKNPPDLSRALKARDLQWAQKIDEELQENYNNSLDKLKNKSELDKPLALLIKACQALEVIDADLPSFTGDKKIREYVYAIDDRISEFKKILGMQ